jgi:hypothetical protein
MIRAEQTLQRLEGMEGKLDTLLHALSLREDESGEVEAIKPLLLATSSTTTSAATGTGTTAHPHLMTATTITHQGMSLVIRGPPVNDKMKDR